MREAAIDQDHGEYAINVSRSVPMVPHPRAICSVLEMEGMTPFAKRYSLLSSALEMPRIDRLCCCAGSL